MNEESTRFDMAAKAVDALCRYVEHNPLQSDPMPFINTAQKALDGLRIIEENCRKLLLAEPPHEMRMGTPEVSIKPIMGALEEWKVKYREFFNNKEIVSKFLKEHKSDMVMLNSLLKTILKLDTIIMNINERLVIMQDGLNKRCKMDKKLKDKGAK